MKRTRAITLFVLTLNQTHSAQPDYQWQLKQQPWPQSQFIIVSRPFCRWHQLPPKTPRSNLIAILGFSLKAEGSEMGNWLLSCLEIMKASRQKQPTAPHALAFFRHQHNSCGPTVKRDKNIGLQMQRMVSGLEVWPPFVLDVCHRIHSRNLVKRMWTNVNVTSMSIYGPEDGLEEKVHGPRSVISYSISLMLTIVLDWYAPRGKKTHFL